MNDRELLEHAAKAANLNIDGWYGEGEADGPWAICNPRPAENVGWNPLTDDGDALRLAVELVLDIEFVWDDVPEETAIACVRVTAIGGEACVFEELGFDPCAATRRAIVRAAAEIGRSA